MEDLNDSSSNCVYGGEDILKSYTQVAIVRPYDTKSLRVSRCVIILFHDYWVQATQNQLMSWQQCMISWIHNELL